MSKSPTATHSNARVTFSNPDGVAAPEGHYSHAARPAANTELLFISGQVARGLVGNTVGIGDMRAQAEQVFKNLQQILHAHGASFADAIKATIYVTDIAQAHLLKQVREQYYGTTKPASTLVAVTALGNPDWLLEIELIAAVPRIGELVQ